MRVVTYADDEAALIESLLAPLTSNVQVVTSDLPGVGSVTVGGHSRDVAARALKATTQNRRPRTAEEQARGERELGADAAERDQLSDSELPGMWSHADFEGGQADAADAQVSWEGITPQGETIKVIDDGVMPPVSGRRYRIAQEVYQGTQHCVIAGTTDHLPLDEVVAAYNHMADLLDALDGPRPESWGPFHRHFASDAIHRDGHAECDQPGTPRRVYVFDPDYLAEHDKSVAGSAVSGLTGRYLAALARLEEASARLADRDSADFRKAVQAARRMYEMAAAPKEET